MSPDDGADDEASICCRRCRNEFSSPRFRCLRLRAGRADGDLLFLIDSMSGVVKTMMCAAREPADVKMNSSRHR